MTLLLDVGNTRLKWAFLSEGRLAHAGDAVHRGQSLTTVLAPLLATPLSPAEIRIASVGGPGLGRAVAGALQARFGIKPRFARSAAGAGRLRSGYADPGQLGVDRWLAICAAWESIGGAVCVVDAGTAITIDLVGGDGQHLGGLIIPGIELMQAALRRETGDLERLSLSANRDGQDAAEPVARDTRRAIGLGAIRAAACLIDDCVETLRTRCGAGTLVLTGGDAAALGRWLKSTVLHRPRLVLEGLALDPGCFEAD